MYLTRVARQTRSCWTSQRPSTRCGINASSSSYTTKEWIRSQTLRRIKSFLSDRTQQGQTSAVGQVTSQSSVLGPTLFVVYINDLNMHTKSTVRLFADDTIFYWQVLSQADARILQEDLETLKNGKRTGKYSSMPASATSSSS